jgi:Mrp family chromosome partitioning ATPase
MTEVSDAAVLDALRKVKDPDLNLDVVSLGFIRGLTIQEARFSFTLELTTPACPAKGLPERQVKDEVMKVPGVREIQVHLTARVRAAGQVGDEVPLVKNTIAFSSGKGGVGKSTVAVNVALALHIDLPPGTGDAQLTLSQAIPLTGAVMVTTPQEVSLMDVRKGTDMFLHLNVPILGVVENMSYYVRPHEERVNVFGEGGGQRLADEYEIPLLGQIPLDPATRQGGDEGVPIQVRAPDSAQAQAFRAVAGAVAARVSTLAFPQLPLISIS